MINLCPYSVYFPLEDERYLVPPAYPEHVEFKTLWGDGRFSENLRQFEGLKRFEAVIVPDEEKYVKWAHHNGLNVLVGTDHGRARWVGYGIYHIVETDNYGGDYPDERFTAMNIQDPRKADTIADSLNGRCRAHDRFYKVVLDGYKLAPKFEP